MATLAKNKNLPQSAARNFFLYLLMFIGLYVTAVSATGVVWQLINLYSQSPIDVYLTPETVKDVLRGFLSALIVSAPLYLFLAVKLNGEVKMHKEVAESAIRRWLTYITLLAAAIIVLVTLIVLVNKLLDGDTTTRFVLHVVDVLAFSGSVFGYYLWDLKQVKQ